MAALLSLLATLLSLVLAVEVGRQFLARRHSYHLVWALALVLFAVGVGCQLVAEVAGWSDAVYRLWYLSGAILAAAVLGQGTVYLLARRRVAHALTALLLAASLYALVAVLLAPVDLAQALGEDGVSGKGMPPSVRVLTPFFNIYGTAALVGGALLSVWRFLWNGGSAHRALGTSVIGLGATLVASGGTLARMGDASWLYASELAAVVAIYLGFRLSSRTGAAFLSKRALAARRRKVAALGVGGSLGGMTLLMFSLPVLPLVAGTLGDVRHVYTERLPDDNRGAYLLTDRGVMQLFAWYLELPEMPGDAPTLPVGSVREIAVVQKQFDEIDTYRLVNLATREPVGWSHWTKHRTQLVLSPAGSLPPGDYLFIRSTDGMYGGVTRHYFRVR